MRVPTRRAAATAHSSVAASSVPRVRSTASLRSVAVVASAPQGLGGGKLASGRAWWGGRGLSLARQFGRGSGSRTRHGRAERARELGLRVARLHLRLRLRCRCTRRARGRRVALARHLLARALLLLQTLLGRLQRACAAAAPQDKINVVRAPR